MAGAVSLSESLQTSIILQHQQQQQEQQLLRQQPQHQQQYTSKQHSRLLQRQLQEQEQQQQQPVGQDEWRVNFCTRLLLVSGLIAVEMIMAFQQIFTVLILQYLGVPVALVTMDGLICGLTTLPVVPALGYLVDRGPRPLFRKRCAVYLALTMYLIGLSGLIVAGFMKGADISALVSSLNRSDTASDHSSFPDNLSVASANSRNMPMFSTYITSTAYLNMDTEPVLSSAGITTTISVTGIMGIFCFACLGIGFDTSTSMLRAYILACSPSSIQAQLLVIATAVQSLGGMTISFMAIFDWPDILGDAFHVDGVAAMLIAFCFFLFLVTCITYNITFFTGRMLARKSETYNSLRCKYSQGPEAHSKCSKDPVAVTSQTARSGHIADSKENIRQGVLKPRKRLVSDDSHTDNEDVSRMPLLEHDVLAKTNYSTISENVSFVYSTSKTSERYSVIPQSYNDGSQTHLRTVSHNVSDVESTDSSPSKDSGDPETSRSVQSEPGDAHLPDLAGQDQQVTNIAHKPAKRSFCSRRLVILCVASSFSTGCALCFTGYSANTLTVGIFHGDPEALPGTEGQERYRKGIQTAAQGNMVMFIAYMVITFSNKKIIDIIGEKAQFIICHILMLASDLALIVTQSVVAYYLVMVSSGFLRTCMLTLPFLLAYKFTQGQDSENKPKNDNQETNLGRVMSLIGTLISLQFVLLSAFMGPLMDALDNVWVPMWYGLVSGSLAILVFIPLFFLKN